MTKERGMYREGCRYVEYAGRGHERNFHFVSCARYSPSFSALSNARTKGAREAHSCRHKILIAILTAEFSFGGVRKTRGRYSF